MDLKDKTLYTTITEECKLECGNNDGFYNGKWIVTNINYRDKTVELSNGRVSISKKFNEVNDILAED